MLSRRRNYFTGDGNEIAGLIFHLPLTENLIDVVGGKNIVWQQSNFNPSFSAEGMFLPQSMMSAYSISDIIPQINGQSLTISFFTKTLAKKSTHQGVCAFSTLGNGNDTSVYVTNFNANTYFNIQRAWRINGTEWSPSTSIYPYDALRTYHIVNVYEWTASNICNVKTYVDKVLYPPSQITTNLGTIPIYEAENFIIGGAVSTYTGNGLVGYLRDVKIFNRALNDDEILNL